MVDMWLKMCEHELKCWEIYLIIPAQRCDQWRMLGGGASLFRPRLVRTTAVMLHPGNLYLGISTTVFISIKCAVGFHTCLRLIVEDIIVRKIEMQALTFCGNDNETRLIVLKP